MNPADSGATPRLLASLRQLALTALGIAHTRLALAGVELEEELQHLVDPLLCRIVNGLGRAFDFNGAA
ncbi:MAG: hypothetical protein H0W47_06735 [Polaromonas sp.]|uniref:hypothetical protein n=1 Tax=Polaromonas sp. TaxID=1869339 RepID=UPI00183FE121|nr:hypothetical protein [Polaromonas sp.]MBA3593480.1 hypothetical protein [Polaromonas sp.]